LFLKGLDILAEPQFINKLIISLVEKHHEHSDSSSAKDLTHSSSVELLKHWCNMNGSIFKTVRFFYDDHEKKSIIYWIDCQIVDQIAHFKRLAEWQWVYAHIHKLSEQFQFDLYSSVLFETQ
jgi:hypothetical protein